MGIDQRALFGNLNQYSLAVIEQASASNFPKFYTCFDHPNTRHWLLRSASELLSFVDNP